MTRTRSTVNDLPEGCRWVFRSAPEEPATPCRTCSKPIKDRAKCVVWLRTWEWYQGLHRTARFYCSRKCASKGEARHD